MNVITLSAEQLDRAKSLLDHIPGGAPKALARAINRAADTARTEAARKVREKYNIKYGDVLSTIRVKGASAGHLSAEIVSRDTRRELINFRVSPNSPRPKDPPVVLRVGVTKGGMKDLPKAFVARGTSSGELHVLSRVGKSRYPLHIKYGPAVPEMMDNQNVREWVEDKASDTLDKRLDHEIGQLLKGYDVDK